LFSDVYFYNYKTSHQIRELLFLIKNKQVKKVADCLHMICPSLAISVQIHKKYVILRLLHKVFLHQDK
jgi:hypothetical protein